MSALTGTNIIAPVVPGDTGDAFPTHVDIYGQGGYFSVSGIYERDNISIDRKSPGMMVYTRDDKKFWSLETGLSSWIELPFTGFYPRIVAENIFYTVDNQDLYSGIKTFKNYNDTKFYVGFVADSGLFFDLSCQGGIFFFSSPPYNLKSGKFKEKKPPRSGERPKRPIRIRTGVGNSPYYYDDEQLDESGILIELELSSTGFRRRIPREISGEDPGGPQIGGGYGDDDGGGGFDVDPGEGGGYEEEPDEEFEDEIDDKETGPERGDGDTTREDDPPIDIGGEFGGGDLDGGGGAGGGGGGGGLGSVGGRGEDKFPILFSSNAPIIRFRNHYSSSIENLRVVQRGDSWPTGFNLQWGPDLFYLFPGEQYIAKSQILSGTGIFENNSGIVGNNLREFRTSGIYNIESPLEWMLKWNGSIEGFLPEYDINPWSGIKRTFIYPVGIRYWGTSSKETLTADEITGLLSGEYAFDPRQPGISKKTFITTGQYIYFAWPADSGFNNIDFFVDYNFSQSKGILHVINLNKNNKGFVEDGYRFIFDKREVYFEQTLVTGVKNSVNYAEDYYLFRNRWILNGDLPISIKVKRRDEEIIDK